MSEEKPFIREDAGYKPSSPDKPAKRFFLEMDSFRWEVCVWQYEIRETGTIIYHAIAEEGYSVYGLTMNEALNDRKEIMLKKVKAAPPTVKTVSLDDVRYYLDPVDAAREDLKIAEKLANKSLFAKILGY